MKYELSEIAEMAKVAEIEQIRRESCEGRFYNCAPLQGWVLRNKPTGASWDEIPEARVLNALHCIDYADMSDELRESIPELVDAVLNYAPPEKPKQQKSWWGFWK